MLAVDFEPSSLDDEQSHSYFIPMVDMLAGVVFILVILLAAATLVSRNEYVKSESAQVEAKRIQADLETARKDAQQKLEQATQAEMLAKQNAERAEAEARLRIQKAEDDATRQIQEAKQLSERALQAQQQAQLAEQQAKLRMEQADLKALQERAQMDQRRMLDPRRQVEMATRILLERLSSILSEKGYRVETSVPEKRLSVLDTNAFVENGTAASIQGGKLADDLGTALSQELSCLSGTSRNETHCAGYPQVRLETAEIHTGGTKNALADKAIADARALVMMSAIIASKPELMSLSSAGGTGVFTYVGDTVQNGQPNKPGSVNIRFEMTVPAQSKN